MADRVGQQFGHYQLTRKLGSGGFADVYLGTHIYLGNEVAIKVIRNELSDEDKELFRTEGRNLVRLIHPNIVRLLDFGIENDIPYLVMDYAPNGSLHVKYPKGTRLPLTTVVTYVKQTAEALPRMNEPVKPFAVPHSLSPLSQKTKEQSSRPLPTHIPAEQPIIEHVGEGGIVVDLLVQ